MMKIDPITAVQDSIDSLALSLFEALRGVRDAVAPDASLSSNTPAPKEETEPVTAESARGELKQILTESEPDGTEIPHDYLNRAHDLLEPDYHAFVLSYLSGDEYSKEIVDRFRALEAEKGGAGAVATTAASSLPVKQEDVESENKECEEASSSPVKQGGVKSEIKDNKQPREDQIGAVGYKFRKLFDAGWFEGKVIELRPLADGGKDRRVLYTDGDMEDLSIEDLQNLAKLDPKHSMKKPRLSIKLKLNRSNSSAADEVEVERDISNSTRPKIPRTEGEFIKFLRKYELECDTRTTQQLAQNVLTKSAEVDNLVAKLPGMDRTRQVQMDRIEELIDMNQAVAEELEETYKLATIKRDEVRDALEQHTSLALGLG